MMTQSLPKTDENRGSMSAVKQDINVAQLQEEVYVVTKGYLKHFEFFLETEKTLTVLHPFLSPLGRCQWLM